MKILPFLLTLLFSPNLRAQIYPLLKAHAHNDYEQEHPLYDALDRGFISVEVDVFLIDGELYVYHDRPPSPDKERTLEKMYLKPLKKWVRQHKGAVYPGCDSFFYLMIDFKSEGLPTYLKLKKILLKYQSIISVVKNGADEQDKPVKIFISGDRPVQEILEDQPKLVGLDGRPADLGKGITNACMPVISDNYYNFFSWKADDETKEKEKEAFIQFVNRAHREGKKVRLWAAPDNEKSWAFLLECGVDLINSDHLEALKNYLSQD